MSLEQNAKKIKPQPELNPEKDLMPFYLFFGLMGLISSLFIWLIWQLVFLNNSYNLSNRPIVIEKSQRVGEISQEPQAAHPSETKNYPKNFYIAASKTGTKYYYQNCAGLGRIKPENLTFFASERQAEGAGYTLARNCQKP
jgi:hypothetical protein